MLQLKPNFSYEWIILCLYVVDISSTEGKEVWWYKIFIIFSVGKWGRGDNRAGFKIFVYQKKINLPAATLKDKIGLYFIAKHPSNTKYVLC